MRETQLPRKPIAYSLVIVFLLFAFNLALNNSEAQSETFQVSVSGTAVGSIPHQIDLKVTQLSEGQLSEVSGFAVSPEDVVQVKQGENLIASTSPDLRTHQVTVRNIQGIPIDLVLLPGNAWSLQGLLPGVYTLDVIADMSSSGILGTFETMLVILAPNQQPLPPTTVIEISIEDTLDCPGNSRLVNGTCVEPSPTPPPTLPTPIPSPTDYCYELFRYMDPEGYEKVCGPPPPPCPEGQTGIPPNCQPVNCDVENPPPECGEQPVVCPDGSTVSPGNECPEPPPVNGGDNGGSGGNGNNGGDGGDGGDNGGTGGDVSNGGNGGDGGDGGIGGDGGGGTIDVPSLFG